MNSLLTSSTLSKVNGYPVTKNVNVEGLALIWPITLLWNFYLLIFCWGKHSCTTVLKPVYSRSCSEDHYVLYFAKKTFNSNFNYRRLKWTIHSFFIFFFFKCWYHAWYIFSILHLSIISLYRGMYIIVTVIDKVYRVHIYAIVLWLVYNN